MKIGKTEGKSGMSQGVRAGGLAQLGERLPCTQEVVSSSLIVSMAVK